MEFKVKVQQKILLSKKLRSIELYLTGSSIVLFCEYEIRYSSSNVNTFGNYRHIMRA